MAAYVGHHYAGPGNHFCVQTSIFSVFYFFTIRNSCSSSLRSCKGIAVAVAAAAATATTAVVAAAAVVNVICFAGKCLHMSGLTKELLHARQDAQLMREYNIGGCS